MHTSLVHYVATLADSRMIVNKRNEVLSGLLKVYGPEDKTPRAPHCISFDVLLNHLRNECIRLQAKHNVDLSFTESDLRRAIASFQPSIGTGRKPHVVIRTDARKDFDDIRSKEQRQADRDEQDKFYATFVNAADMSLPSLVVSVDGVLQSI